MHQLYRIRIKADLNNQRRLLFIINYLLWSMTSLWIVDARLLVMVNSNSIAADAAQNAAMQPVMNPVNGAEVQTDAQTTEPTKGDVGGEPTKSKLEVAKSSSYSEQHKAFGTHFGKTEKSVAALLKRVADQRKNLATWAANLDELEALLLEKEAAAKFEGMTGIIPHLSADQKAKLMTLLAS